MMEPAYLVLIAILVSGILIVLIGMIGSLLHSAQLHKTVRMALEKGQPLPEDLARVLAHHKGPPRERNHLAGGVSLIAIALGMVAGALILYLGLSMENVVFRASALTIMAGATVLGFLGVALLLLHVLRKSGKGD